MATFKIVKDETGNERTVCLEDERAWFFGEVEYAYAKKADFVCIKFIKGGIVCKTLVPTNTGTLSYHKRIELWTEAANYSMSGNFEGFIKDDVELFCNGEKNDEEL